MVFVEEVFKCLILAYSLNPMNTRHIVAHMRQQLFLADICADLNAWKVHKAVIYDFFVIINKKARLGVRSSIWINPGSDLNGSGLLIVKRWKRCC